MKFPHLAYLGFQQIQPHPALRPYIECYWVIESQSTSQPSTGEFMHPNGSNGIIFSLRDVLSLDGELISAKYFRGGANTASRKLAVAGNVKAIGIRFTVIGMYALHAVPMNELLQDELVYAPGDFRKLDAVYERMVNVEQLEDQIAHLEAWLLESVRRAQDTPATVQQSLQIINHQAGYLSIRQVADELFISDRQLERLFKTHIGITPKQYARVQRVARARTLLKRVDDVTLLETAQDAGYYDQSHFIREFKSVVGMTPGAYRERIEKRNQKLAET